MRYGKPDTVQTEIVTGLRAAGYSVLYLTGLGRGAPDLLVGRRGQAWLMEVKTGSATRTALQLTWAQAWRGPPVHVVRSLESALQVVHG